MQVCVWEVRGNDIVENKIAKEDWKGVISNNMPQRIAERMCCD